MTAGPIGSTFDPHSPQAMAISSLFGQTLIVCGVIGAVVTALVVTCIVRFRAGKRPEEPAQTHGNRKLEITWTLIPFVIVLGLFALTAHAMAASDPPADREPDIVVVGHQWWWEARYAGGAVTANEIHVPVGEDVLLRIESSDVIHDFWVPQLGRKVDAIPGHPSTIWIQADAPGTYLGACAEFCGAEHAWMRIVVVADAPADFARWNAHQREPAEQAAMTSDEARGEKTFRAKTCINCHAIRGVGDAAVAPDLTHLAGRRTLGAGVLTNDPASLARWLREPQVVKPASHMPNLNLTEPEVADLTAYLDALR